MAIYACNLCGYVYDEEQEGKPWDELPDDWTCPGCVAHPNLNLVLSSKKS